VAATLAASAGLGAATFLDGPLRDWAAALDPGLRAFWRAAAEIGLSGWMLAAAGALAGLAWVEARRARGPAAAALDALAGRAAFCLVAVGALGLLAATLKLAIGRARPKLHDTLGTFWFEPLAFDYKLNSLPSGHATTLFALATALALLAPAWRAPLYAAAAWGAFGRVAAGHHYLSDVLAGAALGHWGTRALAAQAAARGWVFNADLGARAPRATATALAGLGAALGAAARAGLGRIARGPGRAR
jgi:undecaprenyl-diphosphatase